jgi:hypothetical protein
MPTLIPLFCISSQMQARKYSFWSRGRLDELPDAYAGALRETISFLETIESTTARTFGLPVTGPSS